MNQRHALLQNSNTAKRLSILYFYSLRVFDFIYFYSSIPSFLSPILLRFSDVTIRRQALIPSGPAAISISNTVAPATEECKLAPLTRPRFKMFPEEGAACHSIHARRDERRLVPDHAMITWISCYRLP